jgi:hypothetical protein
MGKLMRETGAQKIDALADFARAAGVPDTAPFRPAHAERLRSLLAGLSVQELRAGAKGKANDATRKKLEPLAEMLNGVARQEILRQAVAQFKAGAFDADLKALKDSGGERWWKLVGSYPFGLSRNRTLLVHANGRDAVGVADVVISECLPNGRVPYEFTRVALRDRNGDAVTDMKIPTKGDAHVLTGCAGSAVAGTAEAAEDTGSTGKGQRQEDADENATGGVVAGVQPAPAQKPAGKRRSASAAPPAPGGRKGGGKKSQAAGTGGPARAVPTHIIADNASKPAPPANAQEQFPATALVRDEPVSAPYRKGQSLSLYVWMWSPGDIWVGVPRVPAVIHSIRYQAGPIPPHGLYRLSRVSVTLPSDVYFRVPKLSARTHVIRSAQIIHALSIRTKTPKTPSVEEKNMIHAFET